MQKITFFTGKGGVGKSTLAAAWAESRRRMGKQVLLVELGSRSFFASAYQWPTPKLEPMQVEPGLSLALWHGAQVLREYLIYLLKSETLVHLFFENSVMRTFLQAAPGLSELAIVGKITSGIRKVGPPLVYDEVVVDCYATGHALALLRVASAMLEVVRIGPMAEQCRTIVETLMNPEICRYMIVSLDGELPKNEAIELDLALRTDLKIRPQIILNRLLVSPVSEEIVADCANQPSEAQAFCLFLRDRLKRQQQAKVDLETITKSKVIELPLIPSTEATKVKEALAEILVELKNV